MANGQKADVGLNVNKSYWPLSPDGANSGCRNYATRPKNSDLWTVDQKMGCYGTTRIADHSCSGVCCCYEDPERLRKVDLSSGNHPDRIRKFDLSTGKHPDTRTSYFRKMESERRRTHISTHARNLQVLLAKTSDSVEGKRRRAVDSETETKKYNNNNNVSNPKTKTETEAEVVSCEHNEEEDIDAHAQSDPSVSSDPSSMGDDRWVEELADIQVTVIQL
jgi:hypothetical protein